MVVPGLASALHTAFYSYMLFKVHIFFTINDTSLNLCKNITDMVSWFQMHAAPLLQPTPTTGSRSLENLRL